MSSIENGFSGGVSISRRALGLCLSGVLLMSGSVFATTYYIDFDGGADSNAGTTAATAFKHSPGDPEAKDKALAVKLVAGDMILFKGGVEYRGQVGITASGSPDKPIILDGNTKGQYGVGKAIIEGSDPLTGWQRCASAADAKGNPRWSEIFYLDVPRPKNWNDLNLSDADSALPIAQTPNPQDPFFQETAEDFFHADASLISKSRGNVTILPEPGTFENPQRPLIQMILDKPTCTGVVCPLRGGGFSCTFATPTAISSVGIAPDPGYSAIKDVAFYGDDKELIKVTLEKGKKEIQKFKLPAAVTIKKLTVKLLEPFAEKNDGYTAIRQVAAYGENDANLLEIVLGNLTLTDPKNLTQTDPDFFKGMMCSFISGNSYISYLPVEGYEPATHQLSLPSFSDTFYKKTDYCFFNSVKLIDQSGEYSVEDNADPKTSRVFLLPPKLDKDQPSNIGVARRTSGIALVDANHIVVQGFLIRRQSGDAVTANHGGHIVVRDCEITLVRGGAALSASGVQSDDKIFKDALDSILIERCYIHHNPGHTKGLVLHTCSNAITRDCKLVKNTSTALDYYHCLDSQVIGCEVLDHRGQHANGLTFYVGNRNILVERNHVARGGCASTFSWVENITFRNNLLDSNLKSAVVGIWNEGTIKNVQFINNTIVRGVPDSYWSVGLFTNHKLIEGLVVQNNIIDGICADGLGAPLHTFDSGIYNNNIFTHKVRDLTEGMLKDGLLEPDLKKIFVDPDKDDFRLKAGSPAIGAGIKTSVTTDITGKQRRNLDKPDIGAYAYPDL